MQLKVPPLIFITGTDGAGKSCLSDWLVQYFKEQGLQAGLVWSRFNNFLSKPLLGLARLTHHNYYKKIDGNLFGFHDFEHLNGFRHLFVLLQAIDVNLAVFRYIRKTKQSYDIIVCERGPWDTIVDVIADTGFDNLSNTLLGRVFTMQVRTGSIVIFINRSKDNIFNSRPQMIHDGKLEKKIDIYSRLAKTYGWFVVDNNQSLAAAKMQICQILGIDATAK
jgi:thymidylate kinase